MRKLGRYVFSVVLLAALAAGSLALVAAPRNSNPCVSGCNDQYTQMWRTCRRAADPDSCRAEAYAVWLACYTACPK